jgi:Arc/MetJ family transcription regulator
MNTHTKKVRKQFLLDPDKLARARRALNAKTDTEAVDKALTRAIANDAMLETLRQFAKYDGPVEDLDVYTELGLV